MPPTFPEINIARCYSDMMLSILYATHFGISITLLHNISSDKSSVNFSAWLLFAFLILPFIISYLISMIIIIYDLYDVYNDEIGEMNPVLPFKLVYLIFTRQHDMIQHIGNNNNNNNNENSFVFTSSNILLLNYIFTMISWMIASLLGPVISIFGICNNEIREICISYQLLSIIPTTILHFTLMNVLVYNYFSLMLFTISFIYILIVTIEYLHKINELCLFSILTETILLFYLTFITFLIYYDKNNQTDQILSLVAFIGFITFCFPNLPYYKSYLLYKYLKWSNLSLIYSFIINKTDKKNVNEMMDKLYSFVHQLSHIDDTNVNNVNLCFLKHSNYLKMNEKHKHKYIRRLVYAHNDNDNDISLCILIFQNGIKIIYTISWIVAYLYPIIWLSIYFAFNTKTSIWNFYDLKALTHQQLFILILFMIHFIFLGLLIGKIYQEILSFKRLEIMKMCYHVAPNAKRQINQQYYGKIEMIYDNLLLIDCLTYIFTNDIGFIILSYSLGHCYQPNYLDGSQIALTYDL